MNPNENKETSLFPIIFIFFCALVYKASPYALNWYYQVRWYLFIFLVIIVLLGLYFLILKVKEHLNEKREEQEGLFVGEKVSVGRNLSILRRFIASFSQNKPLYILESQRTTHTQVIGTTGCGKTESVILPWIVQDIRAGKGVLIIDGKSDSDFLEKLYSYTAYFKREGDFKFFSLAHIDKSHSFNPLNGNSAIEISERVFSSFDFENEYYKNIQYKIFLNLIILIKERTTPSFKFIHSLLTNMDELSLLTEKCVDKQAQIILKAFMALPEKQREERVSGLESQLSHFAQSECKILFDETQSNISISEALREGQIVYFQLPTMSYPFLGSATGKLVLQGLQNAISKRHLSSDKNKFFSVYLDDFQDYIYEGFGSLLNKSRSANVGMVFSHQSIGDLERVSSSFSDVVLTNTNLKIIMRTTEPKTCDYFAKSFGTISSFKTTDQIDSDFVGTSKTGKGTLRKVEEYIFHPNIFRNLPVGCGVVSVPESDTVKHFRLSFPRLKGIEKSSLKAIERGSAEQGPVKFKESKGSEDVIHEAVIN